MAAQNIEQPGNGKHHAIAKRKLMNRARVVDMKAIIHQICVKPKTATLYDSSGDAMVVKQTHIVQDVGSFVCGWLSSSCVVSALNEF